MAFDVFESIADTIVADQCPTVFGGIRTWDGTPETK